MLFITKLVVIKGAARRIKEIYVLAKGAMVSVLPKAMTSGSRNRKPRISMTNPRNMEQKNPVEAMMPALSLSLAPSSLETMLPLP